MLVSPDLLSEFSQIQLKVLGITCGARARRWRLRLWIFVWPQAGTGYRTGGAFRSPTSQRITEFWEAGDQGVFLSWQPHLKHVTIEMTSQIRSKTSLLLELPTKTCLDPPFWSNLHSAHVVNNHDWGSFYRKHHPANWRYTQSYKLYWGCLGNNHINLAYSPKSLQFQRFHKGIFSTKL